MIKRRYGTVILECDSCGDECITDENDFREALITAKNQDWVIRKSSNEWVHVCPDCQEAELV